MKKILILLLAILINNTAKAQLDNIFSFNTSNQQLIQLAIDGAFVNIEQTYRLKDSEGKLYGRKGNKEFGKLSCWGIKTSNGILVNSIIKTPWDNDSNFEKYKDRYAPENYKTTIRDDKNEYILDSLIFLPCIGQDKIALLEDTISFFNEGLTLDCTCNNGDKEGWIVWLVGSEDNDSISEKIIIKKNLTFKKDVYLYEIEQPNTDKKVIGGVYVIPSSDSIGFLLIKLAGVIVKSEAKWVLCRPDISLREKHETGTQEVFPTEATNEDELTPIVEGDNKVTKKKNSKKNKK